MKPLSMEKRERILDAATDLFGSRPYHKVLLSDVASTAGVGKGTLYLYFESKDELYLSVLFRGFAQLLERVRDTLASGAGSPEAQLTCIIRELVQRIYGCTVITELLRGAVVGFPSDGEWADMLKEMRALIETVIRRGVEQGVFEDEHPALTAQYIPGLIRSVSKFKPEDVDVDTVFEHVCDFVLKSLRKRS